MNKKKRQINIVLDEMYEAGLMPRLCDEKSMHIKVDGWDYWVKKGTIWHPSMRKSTKGNSVEDFISKVKQKPSVNRKQRKRLKHTFYWKCFECKRTTVQEIDTCECGEPIPKRS